MITILVNLGTKQVDRKTRTMPLVKSRVVMSRVKEARLQLLPHAPYLAPSNFWLFLNLKMKRKRKMLK